MKLLILNILLFFNQSETVKDIEAISVTDAKAALEEIVVPYSSKDGLSAKDVILLDEMIVTPDVLDRLYMPLVIPIPPPFPQPINPPLVTDVNP